MRSLVALCSSATCRDRCSVGVGRERGVKLPWTKAVTGQRTPKTWHSCLATSLADSSSKCLIANEDLDTLHRRKLSRGRINLRFDAGFVAHTCDRQRACQSDGSCVVNNRG